MSLSVFTHIYFSSSSHSMTWWTFVDRQEHAPELNPWQGDVSHQGIRERKSTDDWKKQWGGCQLSIQTGYLSHHKSSDHFFLILFQDKPRLFSLRALVHIQRLNAVERRNDTFTAQNRALLTNEQTFNTGIFKTDIGGDNEGRPGDKPLSQHPDQPCDALYRHTFVQWTTTWPRPCQGTWRALDQSRSWCWRFSIRCQVHTIQVKQRDFVRTNTHARRKKKKKWEPTSKQAGENGVSFPFANIDYCF